MNTKRLLNPIIALAAMAVILCGCQKKEASLQMLSRDFTFSENCKPIDLPYGQWPMTFGDTTAKSFSLRFRTPLPLPMNEKLVDIEDIVMVETYPANSAGDQLINATLFLTDSITGDTPRRRAITLSVPVSELTPDISHDVVVNYTGKDVSLYIDGHLYDSDFPIGTPATGKHLAKIAANRMNVQFYTPALTPVRDESFTSDIPQYWTPPYGNAWVGDVVACYFNGRYHIFYLFDRRGHKSKFGNGGHYFEHLSTPDLINWTEHEAAVPIDKQWETLGTGTPFVHNGELCLSYGLHTTRLFPYERTTLPNMKADYDSLGYTRSLSYDTISGLIPAGSTYAVSHDGGITFEKSHKLFHYCENPSIYVDSLGNLMMLANYGARGTWQSDSLNGGWHSIDADFPPGGDCTFPFRIGNRDYVIGGFSGMWSKPAGTPVTEFRDIVKEGKDCYNGLSVPAVTTLPDGRTIMSGWIKMQNWGGALATHEIIADGNEGTLGSRWIEELIPHLPEVTLSPSAVEATPASFICEFTLTPAEAGKGTATINFGEGTLWTLDLNSDRAWFASSADDKPRTLGEGGDLSGARNYAIPARVAANKNIPVRLLVYSRPKFKGSIIDVEIDGRRTMLSFRPDLTVNEISFRDEGISLGH